MKISEVIERLEITRVHVGDVDCLIEVATEGSFHMVPVGEVAYDDREGHGKSVAFII